MLFNKEIMMKKKIGIISIAFVFMTIFGCARALPDREAGYGIVAVPFKVINSSGFGFIHTIELKSSEDDTFSVFIEPQLYRDDVVLSGLIAEGDYTVDTMIISFNLDPDVISTINKETTKIEDPYIIRVKEGEICVFPSLLVGEQTIIGERINANYKSIPFNDEMADFYFKRIKQRENSDQWEISILKFRNAN